MKHLFTAGALALSLLAAPAFADPATVMAPGGPGGGYDAMARLPFQAMQEALPENVGSRALAALTALTSGLDATQTAYLDAMREADQSAAVVAIGELKAAISSIRVDLITDMAEISGEVAILIEDARSRIQPLLG